MSDIFTKLSNPDDRKQFIVRYDVSIERSGYGKFYVTGWYIHGMTQSGSRLKFRYEASSMRTEYEYNYLVSKLRRYELPRCTGLFESLYESGVPEEISNWGGDGQLHGKFESFYDRGQNKVTCNYYRGDLDGKYIVRYQNFVTEVEINYSHGIHNGIMKGRYDTGYKEYYVNYKDGNKDGDEIYFYPSGSPKALTQYLDGVRHGMDIKWDKYGDVTMLTYYNNGTQYHSWYSVLGFDSLILTKYVKDTELFDPII